MPLGLLIPIIAPLATEVLKWFVRVVIPDKFIESVPPALVPALSTAVGGVLAYYDPALGIDPAIGAALGLAGTGVHQQVRLITKKEN